MEAATPLRQTRVTALMGLLIVENLVVDDATAAELVRVRTDAGENPVRVVSDAIEIGARVLDREDVGAEVDYVRAEFERASGEARMHSDDAAINESHPPHPAASVPSLRHFRRT